MWNLHGDLHEACVGLGLLQSDETPHELHDASIRTDLADLGVHHQSLEAADCLCLVQLQGVLQEAREGLDLSSRRVGIASDVQGIHQHVTDGLVLAGGWGLQAVWLNKIMNPSIMHSMCCLFTFQYPVILRRRSQTSDGTDARPLLHEVSPVCTAQPACSLQLLPIFADSFPQGLVVHLLGLQVDLRKATEVFRDAPLDSLIRIPSA